MGNLDQLRLRTRLFDWLTNVSSFPLTPFSFNPNVTSTNGLHTTTNSLIDRLWPSQHRSINLRMRNQLPAPKHKLNMRLSISSLNPFAKQPPITSTTKLPTPTTRRTSVRVTRSDLISINQMHAASLNGLAGQFVAVAAGTGSSQLATSGHQHHSNQATDLGNNQIDSSANSIQIGVEQQVHRRPAAQSSSVSQQFVGPPVAQSQPPPVLELSQPSSTVPSGASPERSPIRPAQSSTSRPNQATSLFPESTGSSINPFGSSQITTGYSTTPGLLQTTKPAPSTTNSVAAITTTTAATTPTTTSNTPALNSIHQSGNVLASFSPPVARPHNALANAKYSLDGIIAVAIFGGFIFLGAIITILVIIIRR